MERMADWMRWLEEASGLGAGAYRNTLLTLAVVAAAALAISVARRLINRQVKDLAAAYYWRRLITYAVGGLALLVAARIWMRGVGSLLTFLGIVSAGLVIALQDIFANVTGWLYILSRKPYGVGDRVEIAGHQGDVVDVRMFNTHLVEIRNWVDADQSTGRILLIPNGKVLREPIANFTRGFDYIWTEVPVLVTFESNWRKAKQILTDLARRHCEHLSPDAEAQIRRAAEQYLIHFAKLTPRVYTSVRDSGVLLTLRYIDKPRNRRNTEETLWEGILEAFAACDDIDFAYPTARQFRNPQEGKPATGGPVISGASPLPSGGTQAGGEPGE
jgi:small-conductance mechanosensitive channel